MSLEQKKVSHWLLIQTGLTKKIIACIEDRQVINKILAHINQQQKSLRREVVVAGIRAPPTESKALMNQ